MVQSTEPSAYGDLTEEQAALNNRLVEAWSKLGVRYWATAVDKESCGCTNVEFGLFREMDRKEMARLLGFSEKELEAAERVNCMLLSTVDQTFSKQEVQDLYKYFANYGNKLRLRRAEAPDSHGIGFHAYPYGGLVHLILHQPGPHGWVSNLYSHVDLRHCEP